MKKYHVAAADGKSYYGCGYESYSEAKELLKISQRHDPQAHIVVEEQHFTNADHIRAMKDEELVDFLWQFNDDSFENVMPFCKNTVECGEKVDSDDISTEMCKRCLLDKLRQPYESEETP